MGGGYDTDAAVHVLSFILVNDTPLAVKESICRCAKWLPLEQAVPIKCDSFFFLLECLCKLKASISRSAFSTFWCSASLWKERGAKEMGVFGEERVAGGMGKYCGAE